MNFPLFPPFVTFSGMDAVLGPANITKNDQIPIEQCISTCKLRPGSGCLGVQIIADGPTRVLQITDCLQQVSHTYVVSKLRVAVFIVKVA